MSVFDKARQIRLFIIDIDGVLSSGTIYYGNDQIEIKGFHTHDGLGLKLLQQTGVEIGVITAKHSAAVMRRLEDLKIKHTYFGYADKLPAYEDLKNKLGLHDKQIAYMGDDLPDLPILQRVHLSISVPDAQEIVKENVDYVTQKNAGLGAVREACEIIMKAQNTYNAILSSYLTNPVAS